MLCIRRRLLAIATATATAGLMGHGAQAQGVFQEVLIETLGAVAEGDCPDHLMSPMLRGTCLQQMPDFGNSLRQRGEIESIELLGTQSTPNGTVEVYMVSFPGSEMTWMVNTLPDGKLFVFWTPG